MTVKKYTKNKDVIEKNYEEKLLLFNVSDGKMLELNKIAKILWQKSGESFTFEDLEKIANDSFYDIKNLNDDLEGFIKKAIKNNLIRDGKN